MTGPVVVVPQPAPEQAGRIRAAWSRPPAPRTTAAEPITDSVAALATRYLVNGYTPEDVAERFEVDRSWCRAVAVRLRGRR
ncbi:hypothetical protein [Micromonospora endophytica]|uniref:Uncharacterized protein n=1 Tax=Micromonospora endophytica TaxID=515350 RepID=A0A2W2D487_9ACTN|nr:hypothetical protein [Micromonospora endophytica]PZF92116.1 hypothetical protein C1I93_20105 [Micromonospora endophytica]RIW42853.1 hypothetical protein D3H59_21750 [Micromonospora endophytica]BCJ61636.1 hypothetical protein Jiend_50580 [Micromonospora endophytica]